MQCIMSLTIQYIVIYTALGIWRSYLDFSGLQYTDSAVQKALKAGSETVFYAPMVCVMMLGLRMRVLQLTKGEGNPPEWVQMCMHSVTYAILVNTLLVMLIPLFIPTTVQVTETGELDTAGGNPFQNVMLATVFTIVRYLVFIGLYAGFGGIIVGVFLFEPPKDVWDGPVPPVSPAVKCTVILSSGFFFVYLCQALARTYSQFAGGSAFMSNFENVMQKAADTFALAPMLCAVFLAARMRALQMDPIAGNPQPWAQNCFYACTYGLITMTVLSVLVPLALGGKAQITGKIEGDVAFEVESNWLAKTLTVIRFLSMLSIYAGFTAVVCSVFTIEHPEGADLTPPLSATMQCVLNLAFQYFLIYFLLWVFFTVEDFTSFSFPGAKDAMESAKSTVAFAPMLAVLFIGTRMRALQLSDNKGAPQAWVQAGMFLATWSLMIQFTMCLLMPLVTGAKYVPDSLDKPAAQPEISNKYGAWTLTIIRYLALVSLMGGVATVATGVFMMTPETANGGGSVPVLDMVPEPAGVNDLPMAKGAMEGVGETVGTGVNGVDSAASTVTG
jgi:hypothetical protein